MAARFNLDPTVFLNTVKKTVMPTGVSDEDIAAFLMVASEYQLNPITREIHAYPKKGGGVQPIVGVDGWAKMISRNEKTNGIEFENETDKNGNLVSATCKIHIKNWDYPVIATEYFTECKRNTEPWNTMPRRMLRHKALMQCGRIAFGISGIIDEDEASMIRDVPATVVDDPLAPGRHERKRSKKIAASMPELTPEEIAQADQRRVELKTQVDELSAHENKMTGVDTGAAIPPDACADYRELCKALERTPRFIEQAIEKARSLYEECEKVRDFASIDHTDEIICGLIVSEFRRSHDAGKGK
jgi:phage recombination protein Bet